MQNRSAQKRKGALVFSFPGPREIEASYSPTCPRKEIHIFSDWKARIPNSSGPAALHRRIVRDRGLIGACVVTKTGTGCILGALVDSPEDQKVRYGGSLGPDDWEEIGTALPEVQESEFGASIAIDFDLAGMRERAIRIVLAWREPVWYASKTEKCTQIYATHFGSASDAAYILVDRHEELPRRILRWQAVIYAERALPPWLRDVLINSLVTIPESSFWSAGKDTLESFVTEGCFE